MGALAPPQQILDGVLTDPARVHAAAWQEMFDSHFMARAERENAPFVKGRVKSINSSRTAPTRWSPTWRI
jgi:beta-phosphoglucomutase-like phosphatase (HAD superfamily)